MSINRISNIPLYLQVKDILKEKIKKGEIKPGDKLPSENQLVAQYGISRPVIRHALGELVNEGWIYQEQGKGTFCLGRQSEKSNKTRNIAVIIQSITEYICPKMVRGIQDVAHLRGYGVILCHSDSNFSKEALHLRNHIKNQTDGLIVDVVLDITPYPNLKYFQEIKNRGIPFVMMYKYIEAPDYDYVKLDDEGGLYKATKYLIDLGHKRIAYIGVIRGRLANERWKGYKKALEENGIKYDKDLVKLEDQNLVDSSEREEWYSKIINEFQSMGKKRPTGITFYTDSRAIIFLKKAKEKGLKIPDDFSIVGFDDYEAAKDLDPPLTTIVNPSYKIGKKAAEILIDKIEGKETKTQKVTFPAYLVKRGSCKRIVNCSG